MEDRSLRQLRIRDAARRSVDARAQLNAIAAQVAALNMGAQQTTKAVTNLEQQKAALETKYRKLQTVAKK